MLFILGPIDDPVVFQLDEENFDFIKSELISQ